MSQLVSISEEDLSEALKQQILYYYNLFFSGDRTDKNRDTLISKNRVLMRFFLLDEEKIISHAAVIYKEIQHDGKSYTLGGIGGVFTSPESQRKGYGSQVVKAATEYIDSLGVDLAVSFCLPKNQRFYERNGWEVLTNSQVLIGPNIEQSKPQSELTIIRYLSDKAKLNKKLFENNPLFLEEAW